MARIIPVFALLALILQLTYGTSPPVELPPDRICPSGQNLCNHRPGQCYTPSTHQCLKYNDGSGGTVCPLGNTFCRGKCLVLNTGKECVAKQGYQPGGADEEICDVGQQLCGLGYCYTPSTHDCVDGNYICDKGQSHCGRECYTPSADVQCIVGSTGWAFVCKPGQQVCGSSGCYNANHKKCIETMYENRIVDI